MLDVCDRGERKRTGHAAATATGESDAVVLTRKRIRRVRISTGATQSALLLVESGRASDPRRGGTGSRHGTRRVRQVVRREWRIDGYHRRFVVCPSILDRKPPLCGLVARMPRLAACRCGPNCRRHPTRLRGIEIHFSANGRTKEILPPCPADGSAPGACWRISWDATKCPSNKFQFLVDIPPPACLPDYSIDYLLTCATRLQ